ncbi:MAG: type II toxin-antitoxin system RelE/ParE family toxin [Actinomycetota bacterium]|nr:type II toxin-antitoxin system RelE/ParE family toxin [Actinomycetota bacterium]
MWEVNVEFVESWLRELDQDSYELVVAALELLQERGPGLGRSLVDAVKTSRHKNMKELRPGSKGRSELRVLFAFDIERNAVLLVAGDKSQNWKKWYTVNIPIADDRLDEHTAALRKEK